MKYVALLRGINVGGNNKIDMKQLVAALTTAGITEVSYYLNTGNIFFTSQQSRSQLTKKIEAVITTEFALNIKALLRDETQIAAVLKKVPIDWHNTPDTKVNVMFLWEKYDSPAILQQLTIRPKIDHVFYESGAIVWKTKQADFNKSGMSKLASSELYQNMTIRNVNTLRKIAERIKN